MELLDMQNSSYQPDHYLPALEAGNILYFPQTPFEIPAEDRACLLSAGQADGNFHKNVAYRPLNGKMTGLGAARPGEEDSVRRALANYSAASIRFLSHLLAPYQPAWRLDYASFRSIEEQGRALPLKKRNDLLHTDAFPTRPTNGGLILRIFSNINPTQERVWLTTGPFAELATQYAEDAGLLRIASRAHSWRKLLRITKRSAYDEFMLAFHDYLKHNSAFQTNCPKYRFVFPPGSTWIVFTDVVAHAVLSGRYAIEQTMIVSRDTLTVKDLAPVSILERISGRKLTNQKG